jgi:hypothetical protein
MAIAVLFDFPGESLEKYDRAIETNPQTRTQPARSVHVCFKTDTGWGVFDVWDSPEDFDSFGAVLGPIFQEFGLSAEPKVYEVHNTM